MASEEAPSGISPPPHFICPFSGLFMDDPVLCANGETYERRAIALWLSEGRQVDPVSFEALTSATLRPDRDLSGLIRQWLASFVPSNARYDMTTRVFVVKGEGAQGADAALKPKKKRHGAAAKAGASQANASRKRASQPGDIVMRVVRERASAFRRHQFKSKLAEAEKKDESEHENWMRSLSDPNNYHNLVVESWRVAEVKAFVSQVEKAPVWNEYAERFAARKINGKMLLMCNEQRLAEWGVDERLHAMCLYSHIKRHIARGGAHEGFHKIVGVHCQEHQEEGRNLIMAASKLREPFAEAFCLYMGWGIGRDLDGAIGRFEDIAKTGSPYAMYMLGYTYDHGMGVEPSLGKAMDWYQKAAELRFAPAINTLGWCTRCGIGVPKDPVKGFHMYRSAAKLGDRTAMTNVGACYLYGIRRGAALAPDEKGKAEAEGDDDDSIDLKQAYRWVKEAAALHCPRALNLLAIMTRDGLVAGTPRGPSADKTAFRLFLRAARLGNRDAQASVGEAYATGAGIGKDLRMAKYWFKISATVRRRILPYHDACWGHEHELI